VFKGITAYDRMYGILFALEDKTVDNIGKLLENYMFSNLAHILAARPRLAENADARLDIKRHDPDQEERKKKDGEEENKPRFDTYDNAVVSVDALRVFLENFLTSLGGAPTTPGTEERVALSTQGFGNSEGVHPGEQGTRPVSAQASHAANVYKTGAKTARPEIAPAPKATEPMLENEDVRLIYRLIGDAVVLRSRGIEYLTIERSDTFLTSLAAAVDKALRS
jgi:hypothetical protein